jgi:hypothetical protein
MKASAWIVTVGASLATVLSAQSATLTPEEISSLAVPRLAKPPAIDGVISNAAEWYFRDIVPLPALAPGKFTVEASLVLKDGKALGPMKASIEKLDEAKAFPEWWGKGIGNADRVLPPFTALRAVQVSGVRNQESDKNDSRLPTSGTFAGFACWGREYALSALGLPLSLTSQGRAILAAPARIVVTRAGKTETVPMGPATIVDAKDWRIRFEGKAAGAGLAFSAKGWMEQDGLVYVELTYAPADGKRHRQGPETPDRPPGGDPEILTTKGPHSVRAISVI